MSLKYWVPWLQMSKIHWVWYLLGDNLVFRDFRWRNFPTFSLRGDILGNRFLTFVNFIPARDFSISLYFSTSENAAPDQLCHLKICQLLIVWSCNFCYGGLMSHLLDLKWYLYLISCTALWDILFWALTWHFEIVLKIETKRLSRMCVRTYILLT